MCAFSLNDLICGRQQRFWNGEAEGLGGLEVDGHFDLHGLLDRQVAGLVSLENPARVDAGQTVRIRKTASVAHQSAGSDELATLRRDRRHRMAEGQRSELFTPGSEE